MDKLLHNIRNTFAFINNILIVTKESEELHMEKVEEMTRTLDEVGFRLKLKGTHIGLIGKNMDRKSSRDRPMSAPYLRLKNTKRTSNCQSIGELGTLL